MPLDHAAGKEKEPAMPEAKLRHPIAILEDFRRRIRPYDAMGMLLSGGGHSAAYNPEDIGYGLIVLVEDWEVAWAEVQEWFRAERPGGA